MAHQAGAYSGFLSMKRLGVFLLPIDRMLVHRRVTPSSKFAGTNLGEERHCQSKVFCLRTQRSALAGLDPDRSIRSPAQ